MVDVDLRVVPCDFHVVNHPEHGKLYYARIYQIIETDTLVTHSFWHKSDYYDNRTLADELGVSIYVNICDVRLSSLYFPEMYKQVLDYVSQSDSH